MSILLFTFLMLYKLLILTILHVCVSGIPVLKNVQKTFTQTFTFNIAPSQADNDYSVSDVIYNLYKAAEYSNGPNYDQEALEDHKQLEGNNEHFSNLDNLKPLDINGNFIEEPAVLSNGREMGSNQWVFPKVRGQFMVPMKDSEVLLQDLVT